VLLQESYKTLDLASLLYIVSTYIVLGLQANPEYH
jgi:hypothetical protein